MKSEDFSKFTFKKFSVSFATELTSWIRNERDLFLWSGRTFEKSFDSAVFKKHLNRNDLHPFSYLDEQNRLMAYGEVVEQKRNHATLCRVIVHPRHRSRGIGRTFCKEIILWIARLGRHNLISLNTLAQNLRARKCYERLGFEEVSLRPQGRIHQANGFRIVVMQMELQSIN